MGKEIPMLKVKMFGKERITYGDVPILFGRNSITKALKLLLILIHSGKNGITRNKLLEDLYGREDLSDAANNLRVTFHRLKKMLIDAGLPEYNYIVYEGGIYYWDSPMETMVDTCVFLELIQNAAKETDKIKKLGMLKEACQLYSGEFLSRLADDEWVLVESVYYKKLYTKALHQLCEMLMEQKEYNEVLRYVESACEMYPFDEWQSVKIDCYISMNRYKDALKEYEATAKLLVEELGVTPSAKMLEQFKTMSKHIHNRPQEIQEIKSGLQEEKKEEGAFYCTLPGFRDAYRIVRRGMERNGQSVFLLVCTIVDSKGRPMGVSDKQAELSDALFIAIKNSLRRTDSFTKYNQSQYLVMLMGTNKENCQIVIDRICDKFTKEHKNWVNYLQFSVSSLYDFEHDL